MPHEKALVREAPACVEGGGSARRLYYPGRCSNARTTARSEPMLDRTPDDNTVGWLIGRRIRLFRLCSSVEQLKAKIQLRKDAEFAEPRDSHLGSFGHRLLRLGQRQIRTERILACRS